LLLIVFPFSIVNGAPVSLDKSASPILLVLFPVTVVYGAVLIVKAAHTFQISIHEETFVGSDSHEEHETLTFKVAIDELSLIVVAVLKVECSLALKLVLLPLALVAVSVSIKYGAVPFFHS
jgi:hypothetical protein